jgi:hypothetical protein
VNNDDYNNNNHHQQPPQLVLYSFTSSFNSQMTNHLVNMRKRENPLTQTNKKQYQGN